MNWLAAALMTVGMCLLLIAIAQTTTWGWGSSRRSALLAPGCVSRRLGRYRGAQRATRWST